MPHSIRKSSGAIPAVRPRLPTTQSESFRRSRLDRATETAQDYVEAIADLAAALGEARVVDLAPNANGGTKPWWLFCVRWASRRSRPNWTPRESNIMSAPKL